MKLIWTVNHDLRQKGGGMREIKFRAWQITDKEWHYFNIPNDFFSGIDYKHKLRYENWCEFTGLKDKNGTEIYEGDILPNGHDDKLCVVEFSPLAGFLANFPEGWFPEYYEVIGNIYENKDLLV